MFDKFSAIFGAILDFLTLLRNIFGKIFNLLKSLFIWTFIALIPLAVIWYSIGKFVDWYEFRDKDPNRGALLVEKDEFDKPLDNIVYLQQGWRVQDSLWFYNMTQGSNLIPYDFFLHLEQADSTSLFRDNTNMNRYRYLPQAKTKLNPDALPVGMARDTYKDKDTGKRKTYMGFTCAACHTNQVNYNGIGIRIDGGPAAADMENFLIDLATALESTLAATENDKEKGERFYSAVLGENEYRTKAEIDKDLKKFALQVRTYTEINHPVNQHFEDGNSDCGAILHATSSECVTHYGFARLDAFGRIYNRVLEHVMNKDELKIILQNTLPNDIWNDVETPLENLFNEEDQTHLVVRALAIVQPRLAESGHDIHDKVLNALRSEIYNPANGPVSYPFLWDIPQHDYVQWTGLVSNGDIGPLGRNVGQVIGVFGTLDWQVKPGWTFNTVLGGQGFGETHIDFRSSINKRNLRRVENHLRSLQSPQWPQHILGEFDRDLVSQGAAIFEQYCVSCHHHIDRDDPDRRVIAHMSNQKTILTDPVTANNAINYSGYSGFVKNEYVGTGMGKITVQRESSLAPLVKFSTQNVVTDWDPDKTPVRRVAEWLYDTLASVFTNKVKTTLKHGDYDPATTVNPFAPLNSYKGRPLNGIWATAPYLHNGSVPNLYELLLPKYRPGDPLTDEFGEPIEYRSDAFYVGSREFNPERVGFRDNGYDGFLFDTSLPGNDNGGHEYAAGITAVDANSDPLPPLSKVQRRALLEYLKTL